MDRLYGNFVRSGDLVFDVGAHVGDRVASFRRLGARVVAVEPQPAMVRALRLLYGRSESVAIEAVAVGREPGRARMLINADNPTVSSVSPAFVEAARGAPGWETQRWSETIDVEVTTLDALIARHGVPAFIKLDVEGFEAEALSRPVAERCTRCHSSSPPSSATWRSPASSVARRWVTRASTRRSGRARRWSVSGWTRKEIARWLIALPQSANSGDIYAVAA